MCFWINTLNYVLEYYGSSYCTVDGSCNRRHMIAENWEELFAASTNKSYVPVTYSQSVAKFTEFSVSEMPLVKLTLLFRVAFELCHHGIGGGSDNMQEGFLCWPAFPKQESCTFHPGPWTQRLWGLGYIGWVTFRWQNKTIQHLLAPQGALGDYHSPSVLLLISIWVYCGAISNYDGICRLAEGLAPCDQSAY